MKTKLLLCFFSLFLVTLSASGQEKKIRYQGEIESGYNFGVGAFSFDKIPLHMINGLRFNKYASLGLGVGVDFLSIYEVGSGFNTRVYPIYVNAKGYLPISKKINLFLSFDIGGFIEEENRQGGFMVSPAIGVNFNLYKSLALNFSFGYDYQGWNSSLYGIGYTINVNSLFLKLGIAF